MPAFYESPDATLHVGDCRSALAALPDGVAQTCVTSPPYWGLRDYGHASQLGQEATPEEYVASMVAVFRDVWRVLRPDGTLWLNLGDSYAGPGGGAQGMTGQRAGRRHTAQVPAKAGAGLRPKDLVGIPWRVAFALQSDGWYLRADIIWHKPNPMPESVRDRPTKAHEYVFLLAKSERYFYDADAAAEQAAGGTRRGDSRKLAERAVARTGGAISGGVARSTLGVSSTRTRNRRTVWTVATRPYRGTHFATFPEELVEPCVLAGSRPGDLVLDPFNGAGTTGLVAMRHRRRYVGVELNPAYAALTVERWGKGVQRALAV